MIVSYIFITITILLWYSFLNSENFYILFMLQLTVPTSEQSMQTLQQGFSNLSINKNTSQTVATQSVQQQQPLTLSFLQNAVSSGNMTFTARKPKLAIPSSNVAAATTTTSSNNNNNMIVPNPVASSSPSSSSLPNATEIVENNNFGQQQQFTPEMLQRLMQKLLIENQRCEDVTKSEAAAVLPNSSGSPASPTSNKTNSNSKIIFLFDFIKETK